MKAFVARTGAEGSLDQRASSNLGPYRASTPVHLAHFLCYPGCGKTGESGAVCGEPGAGTRGKCGAR